MKSDEYRECGLHRVAAVVPDVRVADVGYNIECIKSILSRLDMMHVEVAVFPELSVTGYTCADLFLQPFLIKKAEEGVHQLINADTSCLFAVGAPVEVDNHLYNCAILIQKGAVLAIVPKSFIPNYGEFYERRWFHPAEGIKTRRISYAGMEDIPFGTDIIVDYAGMKIGAEICEDLWTPAPPSSYLAMAGADVILNLSASNAVIGKQNYRRDLILQQSARCRSVYLYASAGLGESSTDLAFPGYAAVAENGVMLDEAKAFGPESTPSDTPEVGRKDSECCRKRAVADIDVERLKSERVKFNTFAVMTPADSYLEIIAGKKEKKECAYEVSLKSRYLDRTPFVPSDASHRNENCAEIISIQCHGLLQRLKAIGFPKMIIGISGGLDSTLALLVAVRTARLAGMSTKDVIGITMPGLATTHRTHNNAWKLMEQLRCTAIEIPIGDAVAQHFRDIGQNPEKYDATYENSQARERTQILMDYANKTGGIVIGTGDLSELALGWCTYNGDHMSMYAVNTSVPKTLVKYLVEWFAMETHDEETRNILLDIIDTPISPELVPAKEGKDEIEQKTEDLVGPYELHDYFLYNTLRNSFSPRKLYYLAKEAFKGVYDEETIMHWLQTFYRRFFNQQFKRSCLPDGPKVGSVCLSPRGDWRMPSDASSKMWQKELDDIIANK